MSTIPNQLLVLTLILIVTNLTLLMIMFYLASIRNFLKKEIMLLEDVTREGEKRQQWSERDAAANLTSRLADLQRERFSPRIVR